MIAPQVPVALFVYRRPDVLAQTLAALRADGIPSLHIYSDAPANEAVAAEVRQVRSLARAIDWCQCELDESPVNRGLGVSVRRGVRLMLERYNSALFFEDDLVCVPGCYRYLVAALERYEEDPRVMCVTGWTHPRIVPSGLKDQPYFDGKGECWAWGTWRRAWKDMPDEALESLRHCAAAGLDIERYGSDLPKMAAEAEAKNLWAVGWWYHILSKRGLCLRPPWSMVEQICWDNSRCTTTTETMMAWKNPPLRLCPPIPSEWPVAPVEHPECPRLWKEAVDGH